MAFDIAFRICIVYITFTEVASWTVDLKEARNFYYEKNNQYNNYNTQYNDVNGYNNEDSYVPNYYGGVQYPTYPTAYAGGYAGGVNYPQRSYQRDWHNVDSIKKYANEYQYQSYMEKKVLDVVKNGTVYLEGLQRAIEQYIETLQNCTRYRRNNTGLIPPIQDSPIWTLPQNNSSQNMSNCERVTRTSELVRRLAQLALWATRELQDRAYRKEYQPFYREKNNREDDELIMKLALFLDRLANLTGYDPNPQDFVTSSPAPPVPTAANLPPLLSLPIPPEVMQQMMTCLSGNSNEPATVRCGMPIPPILLEMFANGGNPPNLPLQPGVPSPPGGPPPPGVPSPPGVSSSSGVPSPSDIASPPSGPPPPGVPSPPDIPSPPSVPSPPGIVSPAGIQSPPGIESPPEIQSPSVGPPNAGTPPSSGSRPLGNWTWTFPPGVFLPGNNNTDPFPQNVTPAKSVRKRSADDPLLKVAKFYVKHKVWENSNANTENYDKVDNSKEFHVDNDLTAPKSVQKRSILKKKSTRLRQPKSLARVITDHIKHRISSDLLKGKHRADEIKHIVRKIQDGVARKFVRKLEHVKKVKRSVTYGNKYLPRISENPKQDISYYVKNKAGRNYNPSLVQAAQSRLYLERAFLTGNIEVMRRFGSNYNPANPAHAYMGALLTIIGDV